MPHIIWSYCSCAAVVFASMILIKWQWRKKSARLPYPPGPKGLPLIGNLLDMPKRDDWLTYMQWSHKYDSDVIYLNLIGTPLVVVNSAEAAFELLDRRSAIYSDRPRMVMMKELIYWELIGFFDYGSKWRNARRIFHQYFNVNTTADYHSQQTKATHELLYHLVHTPEKFREHVRLMATSFILNVVYGLDIQSVDDPFIAKIEEIMKASSQVLLPGSFLVDTLPFLRYVPEWVPGAGFQRKAREWRKIAIESAEVPFRYAKDAMAKGTHTPSTTTLALERFQDDEDTQHSIRISSYTTYAGGADTTVSALHTFFLAMALYPDVVRKAQKELDTVVGQAMLPDFSDEPSLPYISAIVKEVIRWYPVTPVGLAHRLMIDDVYEGRFLPAGSIIVANSWAMLHDESYYKDPGTFNPERFLKDGKLDPGVRSPELFAFGFGRRICPGRHLALSSLFFNIACILAMFDIGKAMDDNGKPIIPKEEYTSGLFIHPLPFKCSITPRSNQASNLISEAYAVYHP